MNILVKLQNQVFKHKNFLYNINLHRFSYLNSTKYLNFHNFNLGKKNLIEI